MSGSISVPNYSNSSFILYPETENNEENNAAIEANSSTASEKQTESQTSPGETTEITDRKCEVIEEPETFLSKAKRLLSKIPTILCIPLRVCTTLLNAGIFAGYYVTVMAITGVGALTGALTGLASKIKARFSSTPSQKSLKDYTVTYAKNTFELMILPYEQLPEKFKGSIFPAISGAALFLFETLAIPGKRIPIEVYEKVCSKAYTATKPYKAITDMTVHIIDMTKSFIQG